MKYCLMMKLCCGDVEGGCMRVYVFCKWIPYE